MRTQHNLLLEKVPLKKIKIQIGAAIEDLETSRDMSVQGRDLLTGTKLKFLIENCKDKQSFKGLLLVMETHQPISRIYIPSTLQVEDLC
jgi:actin-like ATPase involved in cell morphogenesis